MVSVRKRILRSGKTRWQVDYRDREGRRRHKQFRRKAEAEAYETELRGNLVAGTHVPDSASITVAQAGELWLQRAVREGLETSTHRQYRQHLKLHIVPLVGNERLSRLDSGAIELFRDRLVETRSRPLARAILTSLKGILKEAQRLKRVAHNAAETVQITRKRRRKGEAAKLTVEIPEKHEIRALLTKATELWPEFTRIERTRKDEQKTVAICWRAMIVTAIFTGMRCSELRGLAWDHVDFQEGMIRIRQRADFQGQMGAPKSEAGVRDIPMAPLVLNTLRAWKLACPRTSAMLVFPTENGRIHSNSNIHKQCWGPLQRAAGIIKIAGGIERPRFTFHSLRHAAASLFIEQGWTPKKVQVVMGHSSIQVTFDTYGKLFKDGQNDQEAMAQLETRLLA